MKKVSISSLPDVLTAKDISRVLGTGYNKALLTIRYGGMNYIRLGNTYHVSKSNFIDWLNCSEPKVIKLD